MSDRDAALERRRILARALHQPRRKIPEQVAALRIAIAQYRERAISIHARLRDLEAAGNDNVSALRATLIASSVQIEAVARTLVDEWPDEPTSRTTASSVRIVAAARTLVESPASARAREEWLDEPTLRR